MDAGEANRNHDSQPQIARSERGVFATGALSIVFAAHHHVAAVFANIGCSLRIGIIDDVEREFGDLRHVAAIRQNSSTKAAKKLEDASFTSVLDYEGGAKAWKEAGETQAV